MTLKNAGNSCSLVKRLSCSAGHMVCHMLCHMLCHMVRHVLCHMIGHMFCHLTMTHHLQWLVMWSAFIFLSISHTFYWLPHSFSSCFAQPHFWLVISIFIISHTSGWTPHFPLVLFALLQPHFWLAPTLILPFSIYPYCCQACTNMVCVPWSVHTLVAI